MNSAIGTTLTVSMAAHVEQTHSLSLEVPLKITSIENGRDLE